MKLVIEIDKDYYDLLKHGVYCGDDYLPIKIIANGTPLPKGHGRLIDADELLKAIDTWDKFGCDADTKLVPYQDHYIPYIHYDDVIKCIKGMPSVNPQPCDDVISRQAVLDAIEDDNRNGMWSCFVSDDDAQKFKTVIKELPSVNPQEPKTGHCKDCKWWKDSDGKFRRGIGAESKCHLNTDVVYEGNGYCYMFEPRKRGLEGEEE